MGFLSPDADYADYTTDSAFGRAAPNGRGGTDEKRVFHLNLTTSSSISELCLFGMLDFYYIICAAATIGSGSAEGRICGIICGICVWG